MKVLILYGSTEGQTRKICRYLRDMAQERGHTTEINDASLNPGNPESFDAVIIGASVHYNKYQSAIAHFVEEYADQLNAMPTAFLSVSMAMASTEDDSRKELEEMTQQFLRKTRWEPSMVEQVAGALRYSKYNFFKKNDHAHDCPKTRWKHGHFGRHRIYRLGPGRADHPPP